MPKITLLIFAMVFFIFGNPVHPLDEVYISEVQFLESGKWKIEITTNYPFNSLSEECSLFIANDTIISNPNHHYKLPIDSLDNQNIYVLNNELFPQITIDTTIYIIGISGNYVRFMQPLAATCTPDFSYIPVGYIGDMQFENYKDGWLKTANPSLGELNTGVILTVKSQLIDQNNQPISKQKIQEERMYSDGFNIWPITTTTHTNDEGYFTISRHPDQFGHISLLPKHIFTQTVTNWTAGITGLFEPGATIELPPIRVDLSVDNIITSNNENQNIKLSHHISDSKVIIYCNQRISLLENITISLHSISGRKIQSNTITSYGPGTYSTSFDNIAKGTYICTISAGDERVTQKITF